MAQSSDVDLDKRRASMARRADHDGVAEDELAQKYNLSGSKRVVKLMSKTIMSHFTPEKIKQKVLDF